MGAQKTMPFLLSIITLILVISRIAPFYLEIPTPQANFTTPLYQNLFGSRYQYQGLSLFIATIFTVLTGLFMYLVIIGLWIFETRNVVPVLLVMLLLSSGIEQQLMSDAYLIPLIVLSSLLLLYSSEKILITSKKVFNISLLIATGALLNVYVLLILPLFLGVFIYLRKGSFKTLVAIITGTILPYWILWAVLYLLGNENTFAHYFTPIKFSLLDTSEISHGYLIYLPGLTLLAAWSFFAFIREYPKMKQNHRDIFLTSNLLAIYALTLALVGILPLQQAMNMAVVSFAFLFTLFYHMASKKQVWVFYTIFLAFFVSSFILQF